MTKRFLLTSFDTWLVEQESNSSDDLLAAVSHLNILPYSLTFLRRLPVHISTASTRVIEQINLTNPDFVIACGMAAQREYLSVESNATNLCVDNCRDNLVNSANELIAPEKISVRTLHTSIDLHQLVAPMANLTISHDCGKFVCEGLYFAILDYLNQQQLKTQCLFLHVPILTLENKAGILDDFLLIIHQLALLQES